MESTLQKTNKHRNFDMRTYFDQKLNPEIQCRKKHKFRKYLFDKAKVETIKEYGGCPKCLLVKKRELEREIYGTEEDIVNELKYGCPEIKICLQMNKGVKTIN